MVNTIYDACYDVLELTINTIENIYGENINKITDELLIFLTTDSSRYEELFDQIKYTNLLENKSYYKKIMMLIIVSTFYKVNLYYTEKGMDIDYEEQSLLEEKNYNQIIDEFRDSEDNPYVFQAIACFCEYLNRSYILKNNCMEEIIAQDKLNIIMEINPFEILNFTNCINPNMLLETEKMIQDFIDLYDCSQNSGCEDEYEIIDIFKEKIDEHFDNDDKKIIFYKYIFSNVYEIIITKCKDNAPFKRRYKYLIQEFLKNDISFNDLYDKFLNDYKFADDLINLFLTANDDLLENDLIERRNYFKSIGNISLLKSLNPFYDEEEKIFEKRKRYHN